MTRRIFIALIVGVVLLLPAVAGAADWLPLVPCGSVGQEPCQPCHLFQAAKNVTDLVLYGITGPIAVFMIVVAGGMMLLGAGNPTMLNRGKNILKNTLLGVGVILISWLATDFLIKSIAAGNDGDTWYEFTCPQFLSDIEVGDLEISPAPPVGLPVPTPAPDAPRSGDSGVPGVSGSAYFAALAQTFNVPSPKKNAGSLEALISCIYTDPVVAALTYPRPAASGRQTSPGNFTYDNSHEVCNYTRGRNPIGGKCSHGLRSCHYGGATGTDGAEAIDFNALLKTVEIPSVLDKDGKPIKVYAGEGELFCELYRVLVKENKCSGFKYLNWEGDHTHVSVNTCDKDGNGASASLPPGACKTHIVSPSPSPVQ